MNKKITTEKQERAIVDLYNNGHSMKYIAHTLSMSTTPIQRVLDENNVPKHPFGSWCIGVPKTTSQNEEEKIVELYKSGLSKKSIEAKTGFGEMVITRVLKDWEVNVRSSGGVRPYNIKSDCFDNLYNEHSAYWLGFLFAEVGVERTNISLALSAKDIDHLSLWRDFIGCEKPIKVFNIGIYKVARLDVSDRALADRIRSLGINPHRPKGEDILDRIPEETLNHFLRGWFDGDGSANKFAQLSFAGREPFLMEVQKIFIRNAHANPVTLKGTERPVIRTLFYKGVNRCNEIAKYLYKDATIWLPRKRDRILAWPPPKNKRSKLFW